MARASRKRERKNAGRCLNRQIVDTLLETEAAARKIPVENFLERKSRPKSAAGGRRRSTPSTTPTAPNSASALCRKRAQQIVDYLRHEPEQKMRVTAGRSAESEIQSRARQGRQRLESQTGGRFGDGRRKNDFRSEISKISSKRLLYEARGRRFRHGFGEFAGGGTRRSASKRRPPNWNVSSSADSGPRNHRQDARIHVRREAKACDADDDRRDFLQKYKAQFFVKRAGAVRRERCGRRRPCREARRTRP